MRMRTRALCGWPTAPTRCTATTTASWSCGGTGSRRARELATRDRERSAGAEGAAGVDGEELPGGLAGVQQRDDRLCHVLGRERRLQRALLAVRLARSEERRVGKECRSRWS